MVRIEMKMPDLSTADAVIKVMKWLVEAGQTVQRGQPLLEIESDKAVMEVEALVTGTLAEIHAEPETEVEVGQVIAIIETEAAEPANAVYFLAAPSSADGQVGRGCQYPAPVASLAHDRQSPGAAMQNGEVISIGEASPAPAPPPAAVPPAASPVVPAAAPAAAPKSGGLFARNRQKAAEAEAKTPEQISSEVQALVQRLRDGDPEVRRVRPGNLTISNLGATGVEAFVPIVNSPEAAILRLADGAGTNAGVFLLTNRDPAGGNTNSTVEGGIWDGNNEHNPRGRDGDPNGYTGARGPSRFTVRDRLWIFTVYAGGNNRETQEKHYIDDYAPGGSRMTPAEGAFWLGVPNLLLIRSKDTPPLPSTEMGRAKTTFEQYATSFQPLDRVVWSVVGGGGEGGMNELPPVLDLARQYPNIRGVFLDDFVRPDKPVNGRMVGRPSLQRADLSHAREQMKAVGRPMDVWVTLYTHEINESRQTASPTFRGCEPPLADFLDQFDVLTLWTWNSDELRELEENLGALEKIAPKKARIALGLYIWDFHNRKPVPVDLMQHQCDLGLKWLKEGRISDLIFLANTVLDVGMPSAEFSRGWIKQHGGEELNR